MAIRQETENISLKSQTATRGLLLAVEARLQYRVLRCAADVFDEVYVLGSKEAAFLEASAFCHRFYTAAEGFLADSQAAITTINDISKELGITHLIPTDLDSTRFLALAKNDLHANCYPTPNPAALDTLNHKGHFATLCRDLSIPHPKTWVVDGKQELIGLVLRGDITFPIVTKPACSEGGINVLVLNTLQELQASSVDYSPVVAQRYIDGIDLSAALYCRSGGIIACVTYLSDCNSVEFVRDPGILQMARPLLEYLGYDGVLCFDLRRNPFGALYFIECNPRFWFHLDHARLAGLNFVQLGVQETDLPEPLPLTVRPQIILKPRGILRAISSPWTLQKRDLVSMEYLTDDLAFFVRTHVPWWHLKTASRFLVGA
jgi:predicted ATP-grasp superfamily ATP-dependent carboligase